VNERIAGGAGAALELLPPRPTPHARSLHGRTVAFLEARRSVELASLVVRHHGVPLAAPCLVELHQPDAPELAAAVDELCSHETTLVVFLTGVGTATIFEAARLRGREQHLLAALAEKRVAVRGPKPTAVLRRLGVRIDITAPPPNTTAELLDALRDEELNGRTVAVQLYGGPNPSLRSAFEQRGARVVELFPYAWDRPADPAPVLGLLDALAARQVDALLVTSAAQVDNLFAIARDHGRGLELRAALGDVAVGAQGPVAAAALRRAGVTAAFEPEHGHMGALVLATARYLGRGHTTPGFTIWLTGLSGAGKSTIANRLAAALHERGRHVEVLDGDEVREHLSKGLGFTKEDRDTNIRRIAYVARVVTRCGAVAITAAISPYREARDAARTQIGRFVEVYVRCPLDELVRRDAKGLYARALRGEIDHFTGVSDPYEPPHAPEIVVDTHLEPPEASARRILDRLEALGLLPGANGVVHERGAGA
jgi:adenylylsulfate kinase